MDGILVSQELRALASSGAIGSQFPLGPGQVQPSSVDLRLGARVWQLQCSFLPGTAGIEKRLERHAIEEQRLDSDRPTVLHHRSVYLVELEERLALPADVRGRTNPKSSTGRLDVFVRVLTEQGYAFDTVPPGYAGRLFAEITPQSFHVAVRRGDCLTQLRLARGPARLSPPELEQQQRTNPAVYWSDGRPAPVEDADTPGIQMSVDLHEGDAGVVGYSAIRNRPPIDLARRDLDRAIYWTPITLDAAREGVMLEPEQFYIFATRERLRIPAELCAELVPFDATKGELRTHYAGFIDSGFGLSSAGDLRGYNRGARLVLEIRTHDVPFLLEHGQPLFRIELLRNGGMPDALYGVGSNYQMQGLKLAKQFGG